MSASHPLCSVCLGSPLPSGRPCICGGEGTQEGELAGFRLLCHQQEKVINGDRSLSPSAQWNALRQHLLDRITIIDAATPWRETEPRWWLEMADVRSLLLRRETP